MLRASRPQSTRNLRLPSAICALNRTSHFQIPKIAAPPHKAAYAGHVALHNALFVRKEFAAITAAISGAKLAEFRPLSRTAPLSPRRRGIPISRRLKARSNPTKQFGAAVPYVVVVFGSSAVAGKIGNSRPAPARCGAAGGQKAARGTMQTVVDSAAINHKLLTKRARVSPGFQARWPGPGALTGNWAHDWKTNGKITNAIMI